MRARAGSGAPGPLAGGLELHAHHHFEAARRMFEDLCPGEVFFPDPEAAGGAAAAAGAAEEEDGGFERVLAIVSLPQPVDLTWWLWLGGEVAADTEGKTS